MDGNTLRQRRQALGMSQSQLAKALNVHKNSLARWERGELGISRPEWLETMLENLKRRNRKMLSTKFRLEPMAHPTDLIYADAGASPPAPMTPVLTLDTRDGSLAIDHERQSDNAVPVAVWHGIVRRWTIPITTNAVELSAAINAGDLDDLFARILAGAHVHRDQQANLVCRLSDNAAVAGDAVQEWLDAWADTLPGDNPGFWEAGDWLVDGPASVDGLTANTADDELEAMAERLEQEALAECIVLHGTRTCLEGFRERLRC